MNNEDTTTDETVVEEVAPKSKLSALKPYAKTILIWTGAVVGVIAGAALISAARTREDEIEILVIQETPNDTVEESPVTTD